MKFPIGFNTGFPKEETTDPVSIEKNNQATKKKSVVQVHFPTRNMTLAYYNEFFDLHRGDIVYVDGKLEGLRGRVVEVNYTFKIKISDYKRVIGVANTNVKGRFYMADSHFVTFDSLALPFNKAITWFKAPENDEQYVSGHDDSSFHLKDLSGMKIQSQVADHGHDYYLENKVLYVCVDGSHGYAIVEGTEPYTVEFDYNNGEISNLTCSCFYSGTCKHEFATMLQLHKILEIIEKNYSKVYSQTNYFAAISKTTFFSLIVDGNEFGSFIFE